MDPEEGGEAVETPASEAKGAAGDVKKQIDTARESMDAVIELLEAITVPDESMITDLWGNVYMFAPVLSARKQAQAVVGMRRIASSVEAELTKRAAGATGWGAILSTLIELIAEDDELADKLHALWLKMHPDLHVDVIEQTRDHEESEHVLDLFESDQIVQGMLPFCARAATKLREAMKPLINVASNRQQ